MTKIICNESELVSIADAIRGAIGSFDKMTLNEMPSMISEISGGVDTCTVTITNNYGADFDVYYITFDPIGTRYLTCTILSMNNTVTFTSAKDSFVLVTSSVDLLHTTLQFQATSSYSHVSDNSIYFFISSDTDIIFTGYNCCFVAGTQIQTSLDGNTVAIETLQSGDSIVAYDIHTDEKYIATVKQLIVNRNTTDIAEVCFDNGATLTMNAYHPIYTKDGFHSITKYNNYEELVVGDIARTSEGWSIITNINRYQSTPIITYNLDVIDTDEVVDEEVNDTYIANGIVVHNAGCAV